MSVVLPLRDGARWLTECLDSVARQSLADHELLVIDDGSRDAGPAMAAGRARIDPRIRVLASPGRGVVAALQHGLRSARAPLVARMDADDRMHPQRLERQLGALEHDSAATLVASRVTAFPQERLAAGMREYLRWQDSCCTPGTIAARIYVEAPFVHPSVTFRRQAVLDLGGYRDGAFPEDYDLWLRLVQHGHPMRKLAEPLLEWRQHPGSLSRTDPRYARGAFDALRARCLARDPRLQGGRPLVVWGAGRRTRARARLLRAEGVVFAAFVDIDPRKIGNVVEGLRVHPPGWLAARPGRRRPFVLAYVASHGARDAIDAALVRMGYAEGEDYLQVG